MTVPAKFKQGCSRAGLALILIFVFRILSEFISSRLTLALISLPDAEENIELISVAVRMTSALVLYGGCIAATAWALGFKKRKLAELYRKPERLGKAVAWVVPGYGAAQAVNITIVFVILFLFKNTDMQALQYYPIASGGGNSAIGLIFQAVLAVIAAPILEEIWFRGIIQTSLSDCGHGFAILVSSFAFGLAHGNIQQFCYTFVMALVLGYVRYATDSLLPTTIIHSIINLIATVMLVIMSQTDFVPAMVKLQTGAALSPSEGACAAAFIIYAIFIIIFILVGICAAIGRLKRRRLYIPINNYPELGKGKKLLGLLTTSEFLLGAALCFIYMFGIWGMILLSVGGA